MTSEERLLLANVRNKIMHSGDDPGFTDEESRVLRRFIEDDELRTLHVRIDWLPRPEQLEISNLVNKLSLDLENRWVADGYVNESEELPDYAQPNPLPVEGISPSDMGFSVQVPVFARKEEKDHPEPTPQSTTWTDRHAAKEGELTHSPKTGLPHEEVLRILDHAGSPEQVLGDGDDDLKQRG